MADSNERFDLCSEYEYSYLTISSRLAVGPHPCSCAVGTRVYSAGPWSWPLSFS